MINASMAEQAGKKDGFIAALDQSGGSTPKALKLYGVAETNIPTKPEMYGLIHEMRVADCHFARLQRRPVIGAILFERTMDADIEGMPSAEYMWKKKGVVPFLKIDQGLEAKRTASS
jgi:fructose-bisphosphate aldolase class I